MGEVVHVGDSVGSPVGAVAATAAVAEDFPILHPGEYVFRPSKSGGSPSRSAVSPHGLYLYF